MDYDRYNQILEWMIEKADLSYLTYIYTKYLLDKNFLAIPLAIYVWLGTLLLTAWLIFRLNKSQLVSDFLIKIGMNKRTNICGLLLSVLFGIFTLGLGAESFKANFYEIRLLDFYGSIFYKSLDEKQKNYFNEQVDNYHLSIISYNNHIKPDSDVWGRIQIEKFLKITKDILDFEATEMSLKNREEYEAFKRDNYERISLLYELKQKEDNKNK